MSTFYMSHEAVVLFSLSVSNGDADVPDNHICIHDNSLGGREWRGEASVETEDGFGFGYYQCFKPGSLRCATFTSASSGASLEIKKMPEVGGYEATYTTGTYASMYAEFIVKSVLNANPSGIKKEINGLWGLSESRKADFISRLNAYYAPLKLVEECEQMLCSHDFGLAILNEMAKEEDVIAMTHTLSHLSSNG